MLNKAYDIYHIIEVKIKEVREKAVKVELLEPPSLDLWVPISCLEYGKEENFQIGLETEISICEWFLAEKELI